MNSRIQKLLQSCFRRHIQTLGPILAAGILVSGGTTQAQIPFESNRTGTAYFNDFRLTSLETESQALPIGIDLLNADYFDYYNATPQTAPGDDAPAGDFKPYRMAVLIMGIIFVLVTFTQALTSLIKNPNSARVPI